MQQAAPTPARMPWRPALDAIGSKAEQFGNDISVEAEEAGCDWADKH